MAEALSEHSSEHTHAVKKILEWYHSLRVDHLSTEELDFELKIRSIVIGDDRSYSRRRRSLRDHLKSEKEEHKFVEVELEINWEDTIEYCRRNYEEIFDGLRQNDKNLRVRGQSKLLHFGHRMVLLLKQADDEAKKFLNAMLDDVVKLLIKYYYMEPGVSGMVNRGDPEDHALIDLFQTEGVLAPLSLPKPGKYSGVGEAGIELPANVPMSPLLESLLTRINDLTLELINRDKKREEESQNIRSEVPGGNQQLTDIPQPTVLTSCSGSLGAPYSGHSRFSQSHTRSTATSVSGLTSSVSFSLPQSYPTASPPMSSSWHSHLQNSSVFQPAGCTQTTNSLVGYPTMSSVPTPSRWQGTSAMNIAPISNPCLGNPASCFSHNSHP